MGKAGRLAFRFITEGAAEVTRLAILDLWRRLVMYTPVDTGRARAAWILAEGSPSNSVPAPGRYGPPRPPALSVNLGDTYFITNNLKYIEALDKGHSEQAPEGFTDRAVDETTRKFS